MDNKNKMKMQTTKEKKRSPHVNLNETSKKFRKMKELNLRCRHLLQCATEVNVNDSLTSLWESYTTMHNMLIDIMNIEKDWNMALPERNAHTINDLIEWVKDNGGVLNGISVNYFGDYGYGFKADRDIEKDDVIMMTPRNVMMTIHNVLNSQLRTLCCDDLMLKEMPNVTLAIFLLIERFQKNVSSYWLPYINALPSAYNTPFYYDLNDFAELRGSSTFEPAIRLCINIARQYAYIKNLIMRRKDDPASQILQTSFTYDQYRWAVSTVMTRQNYIYNSFGNKTLTFIPLWDLFNHAEPEDGSNVPNTTYEVGVDYSVCQAFQRFTAGEQVFVYYGDRSNADFLIHNGFVYPDHKSDRMPAKFGLSKSDLYFEKRAALLNELEIVHHGDFTINDDVNEPFHSDLLAFVRVFKLVSEKLDFWLEKSSENYNLLFRRALFSWTKDDELVTTDKDVEFYNELDNLVLTYLKNRVAILLRSYPTTIEEDEALLKNQELNHMRRLIIMQRMKEKQILTKALAACTLLKITDASNAASTTTCDATITSVTTTIAKLKT